MLIEFFNSYGRAVEVWGAPLSITLRVNLNARRCVPGATTAADLGYRRAGEQCNRINSSGYDLFEGETRIRGDSSARRVERREHSEIRQWIPGCMFSFIRYERGRIFPMTFRKRSEPGTLKPARFCRRTIRTGLRDLRNIRRVCSCSMANRSTLFPIRHRRNRLWRSGSMNSYSSKREPACYSVG